MAGILNGITELVGNTPLMEAVNLEKKEAYVEAGANVSKEELAKAVTEAGYEVLSVE